MHEKMKGMDLNMELKYADELKHIGTYPQIDAMPASPKYNTPITPRENYRRFFRGEKPMWFPLSTDSFKFDPNIVPDNISRAFVSEVDYVPVSEAGGPDWFGVMWEYIPMAGGSMVKPGSPKVPDICEWEKYITFPDLDKLDWQGCADRNKEILQNRDRWMTMTMFTGLFERLISFMDFENAATALIDEDEQEAVHRLFDKLADFYCELIRRFKKYFDPDMVVFHDDWGSQRAPFFSTDTLKEMVLPYLKRIVDCAHENDIVFELHSCGFIEPHVPAFIEIGVDCWRGQPMNDKKKLVDMYGDKFIFGVQVDVPEGDEDAVYAAAKEFMDTYGDKNVLVNIYGRTNPKNSALLRDYIYSLSRDKLAK